MVKLPDSKLISGATGFIGRRLTQRLLDDLFSVRNMVRNTTSVLPLTSSVTLADAYCGEDFYRLFSRKVSP